MEKSTRVYSLIFAIRVCATRKGPFLGQNFHKKSIFITQKLQ